MANIKNIVQVMNFHSLIRVDKAKREANKYFGVEDEINRLLYSITNNKNLKLDKKLLLTNDNGTYNNTYYQVKGELNITEEEMNKLMESEPLNSKLKLVLDSIVKYKLRNDKTARYSNNELYSMIEEGTNNTPNIEEELKNKVINTSDRYKQEIFDFLYDIEVSLIEG